MASVRNIQILSYLFSSLSVCLKVVFSHGSHLLVTHQEDKTKGKKRDTRYTFPRPFRKHGVVPLATYVRIYKKGDIVDIKEIVTVQKRNVS